MAADSFTGFVPLAQTFELRHGVARDGTQDLVGLLGGEADVGFEQASIMGQRDIEAANGLRCSSPARPESSMTTAPGQ
jgi:hypothetical protein